MDSNIMQCKDPIAFISPNIIEIGNSSYRTYERLNEDWLETPEKQKLPAYTDNDDFMIDCTELEDNYEIKMTKSGKFLTEIHVPNYFIPFVIGNKGLKKREIESSTRTSIKLPKTEKDNITITGDTERDIASARNRIYMILLEQRERHRVTHFISMRVYSTMIKENFEIFKNSILNGPIIRGIHPSLFQKPEKFHLTIATLVLLDDIEIDDAINTLHDCQYDVVKPLLENVEPPLYIHLHEVEIMNDDPTDVDVLYGKVRISPAKYNSIFQTLADDIANYFARKGFIRKQYDSVKLHVTLMNSLFRKNDTNNKNDDVKRESFDASPIIQKYKHFYFGEAELDFIHLSVRFGKTDDSGDYYYESLTTIPFF